MKQHNIKDRQSLVDVAVSRLGGIESLMRLAEENGVSITGELATDNELMLSGITAADPQVVKQYEYNAIVPATGITEELFPTGIEYWGIEINFIVR